jgi:TolB-like protein/DNA-binding winged helix-turn-helix (wHTH) protein
MNAPDLCFYQFGPFCLDAEKRVLLHDRGVVPLTPKAFDTLLVLVRHQGEVLEKDQLIEMLWPDSFVEEGNLTYNISAIRKALGESPNERKYIITIPGKGYKFAADVKCMSGAQSDVVLARYTKATLVVQEPEQSHRLETGQKGLLTANVFFIGKRKAILFGLVLAIFVLGAIALYFLSRSDVPTSHAIRSIAIIPFVSTSNDPNVEYLSDGITESLINSFSQLSGVKVIARTTVFRYKGKQVDAKAIGRELAVDAIITGKVTQQLDNLIVQTDLLRTSDGSQLWGSRYTRKPSDIFAVEGQIAEEISENLQFKLTGEEKRALSRRTTENFRAYQDYLLGWSYLHRRTRQDFFYAIDYFEKAIAEEPNYALAYTALTEAYTSLVIRGFIAPDEGRRKAEEAARRALSLDPNLAEAHAAIGETRIHFAPFDFHTGDQELRRAIELSPSLAIAHQYLGASMLEQGRLGEAIAVFQEARQLDPLSPLIARMLAYSYHLKRDYAGSLELLRQSYELGPPFIIWGEAEIYIQNGELTEGLAELDKAQSQRTDDPLLAYSQGMLYAAQGKRAEAARIISN